MGLGVVTSLATNSYGVVTAASGVPVGANLSKFFGVSAGGVLGWYDASSGGGGTGGLTGVIYGEAILGSTYTVTADDAWEDTGLTITLPEAGTYLIFGEACGYGEVSSSNGTLIVRLYDSTNAAALPYSGKQVLYVSGTEALGMSAPFAAGFYQVTAAAVISLQVRSHSTAGWTSRKIRSNDQAAVVDSVTAIRFIRLPIGAGSITIPVLTPASFTWTARAPVVTIGVTVTPARATMTWTARVPTVDIIDTVVHAPTASMTWTAHAPTVTVGVTVSPSPATMTWTARSAPVTYGTTVSVPGNDPPHITWTAYAPTVTTAGGGIQLVAGQTASNTGTGGGPVNVTWPATTTANNLLIAVVTASKPIGGAPTITAPSGWTQAVTGTNGGLRLSIYYKENAAAQSTTGNWTCTTSLGAGSLTVLVAEYSGCLTSSSLDQAPAAATGTSTTPASGTTGTTSQAAELLIVGLGSGTGGAGTFSSPTNSFVIEKQVATLFPTCMLDRIVAATGTYTGGATISTSAPPWVAAIATFKGV